MTGDWHTNLLRILTLSTIDFYLGHEISKVLNCNTRITCYVGVYYVHFFYALHYGYKHDHWHFGFSIHAWHF